MAAVDGALVAVAIAGSGGVQGPALDVFAYAALPPPAEPPPVPPPPEVPAADRNRAASTRANRRVDSLIDPGLADHVWENGSQRRAAGAETRVYLALATRRGAFFGNPRLGSRLHLLPGEKCLESRVVKAEDYAKEALSDQVRQGLLIGLTVKAELDAQVRGRVNLLITATDGLTGQPVSVMYPVV